MDLVEKPTRQNKILDHILISTDLETWYNKDSVQYDAPIGNADHLVITVSPNAYIDSVNKVSKNMLYDYRHSHIQNLYDSMASIEWSFLSEISDVNE